MDALQETRRQLAAMRGELKQSNSELYRHLALYLQVLRDGLLNALQQACFRLATQIQPERYCLLAPSRRRELHSRMADLSRRARSLLTVEQVAAMAAQIARADQRDQRERQARLLEEIHRAQQDSTAEPGSIHLGMLPPIDRDLNLGPFHASTVGPELPAGELELPREAKPAASAESAPLDGVLAAMAEALQATQAAPSPPSEGAGVPWDAPGLPDDPLQLLSWLEGYEAALARRLRNLSHAINVDCLRLGLTQGLLPVGLLDAALQGQVDLLPAPPNLLRLQIPAGTVSAEGPLALVAVLLRLSDLELENPRLRTCRQRLQQHSQQINRMAQTYRRVQRRLKTLEAERLWLDDTQSSLIGTVPPP